jgi:hypothetical protein
MWNLHHLKIIYFCLGAIVGMVIAVTVIAYIFWGFHLAGKL